MQTSLHIFGGTVAHWGQYSLEVLHNCYENSRFCVTYLRFPLRDAHYTEQTARHEQRRPSDSRSS